jgi:hypothetical protein
MCSEAEDENKNKIEHDNQIKDDNIPEVNPPAQDSSDTSYVIVEASGSEDDGFVVIDKGEACRGDLATQNSADTPLYASTCVDDSVTAPNEIITITDAEGTAEEKTDVVVMGADAEGDQVVKDLADAADDLIGIAD